MKIKSKIKNYEISFVNNVLGNKKELFTSLKYERLFFFVDENVYDLFGSSLQKFIGKAPLIVIPAKEQNKSYIKLVKHYRKLVEFKFTRNDILVTFGGGILQDISGFIASTLYRGIKWVFIPTTLLAQADSCIGSKTSINFDNSKNLIGTFYPPDNIFVDTSFCKTLTNADFNSGLGEIIKFHLMSNQKGYALLKKFLKCDDLRDNRHFQNVVQSTLKIKYSYFKDDEFDSGRRNLLNYGHCFGHALESASNFSISHGEAVIVGMGFANLVSLRRGIMTQEKFNEFEAIFRKHYPHFSLSKIKADDIIYFLKRDKKRVGKDLTMILSEDVGKQFKYNDLKEREVKKIFNDFVKYYISLNLRNK